MSVYLTQNVVNKCIELNCSIYVFEKCVNCI